jgi:Gram-negative bacterial TonB protein C-terminal
MLATSLALLSLSAAHPAVASDSVNAPVVSYFDEKEWKERQRKLRQKFTPICKKIIANSKKLDVIVDDPDLSDADISDAAQNLLAGYNGCAKKPALAVALLDRMVAPAPFTAQREYIGQLARYSIIDDTALSPERWLEIGSILWVRGYPDMQSLKLTDAERHAFIARDDVWAYLNGDARENWQRDLIIVEALFDPLSPRHDPAAAVAYIEKNLPSSAALNYKAARHLLDNPAIDNSEARAVALLKKAAPYLDDARARYFEMVRPRLNSVETEIRNSAVQEVVALLPYGREMAAAARQELSPVFSANLADSDEATATQASVMLAQFYRDGTPSAETALLPWLDTRLRGSDEQLKSQSLATLASLSMAGSAGARVLIDADIKRTGGAIEFGLVGEAQGLRSGFIVADDYPAKALREEQQGVVAARMLIAPNGRAVLGEILRSSGPMLDQALIRNAIRRLRLKFPDHVGRYVWVRLPDVQFRLKQCVTGDALEPVQQGAVLVEAECRIEIVMDKPVSVF